MHPKSIEKIAFTKPQGLFEVRVMQFGLTNAPSVIQRLIQKLLAGLNPPEGPDVVSVYIDDILVYSRSLDEHLDHLRRVIRHLQEAGLKLKPEKCHLICTEVKYLDHVVTPQGMKPKSKTASAVSTFPVPTNVCEVQRFLRLSSYYW